MKTLLLIILVSNVAFATGEATPSHLGCGNQITQGGAGKFVRVATSVGKRESFTVAADAKGSLYVAHDARRQLGFTSQGYAFVEKLPITFKHPPSSLSAFCADREESPLNGFIGVVAEKAAWLIDPDLKQMLLAQDLGAEEIKSISLVHGGDFTLRVFILTNNALYFSDYSTYSGKLEGDHDFKLFLKISDCDMVHAVSSGVVLLLKRGDHGKSTLLKADKKKAKVLGTMKDWVRSLSGLLRGNKLTATVLTFGKVGKEFKSRIFHWESTRPWFEEYPLPEGTKGASDLSVATRKGPENGGRYVPANSLNGYLDRRYPRDRFRRERRLALVDGEIASWDDRGWNLVDWNPLPTNSRMNAEDTIFSLFEGDDGDWNPDKQWIANYLRKFDSLSDTRRHSLAGAWRERFRYRYYLEYPEAELSEIMIRLKLDDIQTQVLALYLMPMSRADDFLHPETFVSADYLTSLVEPIAKMLNMKQPRDSSVYGTLINRMGERLAFSFAEMESRFTKFATSRERLQNSLGENLIDFMRQEEIDPTWKLTFGDEIFDEELIEKE